MITGTKHDGKMDDDNIYLNAYIESADMEISAIERRKKSILNSYVEKYQDLIDGDIIEVIHTVKYKDDDNFKYKVTYGIVLTNTIERHPITGKYDLCYHAKKCNKDGSIKRKSTFEDKLFHSDLLKWDWKFINHVPRGMSLIQKIIKQSVEKTETPGSTCGDCHRIFKECICP